MAATKTDSGPVSGRPAPTAGGERIAVIDALRGFALFGILLVNMQIFSTPWFDRGASALLFPGPLDRAAEWLIRFLAEGKFIALFAFLFGLGIQLQAERSRDEQILRRRLRWLLLFGLIHAVLIWSGDVLLLYALLGFPLLRFRDRQPRTLAIWIALCLALPLAAGALLGYLDQGDDAGLAGLTQMALQIYAHGSYAQILLLRMIELGLIYLGMLLSLNILQVFALFLLGMLAGRIHLPQQIARHQPLLRTLVRWALPAGTALALLFAATSGDGPLAYALGGLLGGPVLGLSYGAGLALLAQRPAWANRLAPLASAGRMAFTNYLLQSAICTLLFYGYGLGLYGRVGPAVGLLLAVLIYLVQVGLSHLWLQRFRFGPLEWLWRSLTYGRAQPMRL